MTRADASGPATGATSAAARPGPGPGPARSAWWRRLLGSFYRGLSYTGASLFLLGFWDPCGQPADEPGQRESVSEIERRFWQQIAADFDPPRGP